MFFTQDDYRKIEQWLSKNSVKDTEFNEAITPFNGNETVAIVQNGHNAKASISDIVKQMFLLGVSDFLNVTDKYGEKYITLTDAIRLIPYMSRKIGQVITFLNTEGNWELYQFQGESILQWNNNTLWVDLLAEIEAKVNVVPDEEDITGVKSEDKTVIKFKDKQYNPDEFSGLGRVYLRKNIVEIEDDLGQLNRINLLQQSMLSKENTIYIIQYDYDLNGQEITVPENCVLQFEGGSISRGTLVGDNTKISSSITFIFGLDIILSGNWSIDKIYPEWFGADTKNSDNYSSIQVAVNMAKSIGSYVYLSNYYKVKNTIVLPEYGKLDGAGRYRCGLILDSETNLLQAKTWCSVKNISLKSTFGEESSNINNTTGTLLLLQDLEYVPEWADQGGACYKVTLENLLVINAPYRGIHTINACYLSYKDISVYSSHGDYNVVFEGGSEQSGSTTINMLGSNEITSSVGKGILINGVSTSKFHFIAEGNTLGAMDIRGNLLHNIFELCYFENNKGEYSIDIDANSCYCNKFDNCFFYETNVTTVLKAKASLASYDNIFKMSGYISSSDIQSDGFVFENTDYTYANKFSGSVRRGGKFWIDSNLKYKPYSLLPNSLFSEWGYPDTNGVRPKGMTYSAGTFDIGIGGYANSPYYVIFQQGTDTSQYNGLVWEHVENYLQEDISSYKLVVAGRKGNAQIIIQLSGNNPGNSTVNHNFSSTSEWQTYTIGEWETSLFNNLNKEDITNLQITVRAVDAGFELGMVSLYDVNNDFFLPISGVNNTSHRNIGLREDRPSDLTQFDQGFKYWDATLRQEIIWDGKKWLNSDGSQASSVVNANMYDNLLYYINNIFTQENTTYNIGTNITIELGRTLNIPNGCTLNFCGGKIIGGGTININGANILPYGCNIKELITASLEGNYKEGQVLYDSSLKKMKLWNGSEWTNLDGTPLE